MLRSNWPGFQLASAVKNLPASQETQESWVQSVGREDPLEKGMATLSSMPARRIPWTEEPGGQCQKDGAQISRTGGLLRRGRENSLCLSAQAKGRPVRTRPAGGHRRAGERPQEEPTPGTSASRAGRTPYLCFSGPAVCSVLTA